TRRLTRALLDLLSFAGLSKPLAAWHSQYLRQESNLVFELRRLACFRHTPKICPGAGARVPQPGIEPGTPPSQGGMMSGFHHQGNPRQAHGWPPVGLKSSSVRGVRLERTLPGSEPGGLPLADPRECPAGVEPACVSLEEMRLATRPRTRAAEGEGVEPSRAFGASPAFEAGAIAEVGLPFRIAVGTVGFEPTISSSRSWRIKPGFPTSRVSGRASPRSCVLQNLQFCALPFGYNQQGWLTGVEPACVCK